MSLRWRALWRLLMPFSLAAGTLRAAVPAVCQGRPSAGALRGGERLEERPYLRIKRGSEDHAWGHPVLLALLSRGARAVEAPVPGSIVVVGDLSAREGGPLPGHASHQAGRDADVGLLVADDQGNAVTLDGFESFGGDGHSLSNSAHVLDVYRNWLMLRVWLSELRVVVTHIFLSPELRLLMLEYGRQSPEFARLVPLASRVLRPHPTHTDHFHLRIACPTDQTAACQDDASAP